MVKNTKQKKRARKSSSNKQKDQVAHKKPRKKVEENNNVVDTELYEVEDIIDCKFDGKEVVYKVRWVGYAPKYDSFEPEFRLMCPDKIKDFAIKKFSCNYSNTDIDMIMEGFEKYCDELFIESANYLAIIGKRFFERGSVSYIEHNTITANKRFLKSIKNFKNDWCFYTLNKNDVTSSANDMKQYMRKVERRIQTSIDYPLVRVFFVSSKDQTTAPPPIKNLTFDLLLPPDDRKRILKRENRKEHPFTSKEPENESKLNSRWDFLNDPMKKKIKHANQFKVNLSLRYREEVGWKLCADHFVAKDSAILQMAGEICDESEAHNSMINDGFPIAISSIFKLGTTGKVLDQRNRFDFSRFLSHSCDPNCKINLSNSHQFEIDGKIVPGLIVTNCEVLDEHGEVLTVDFFKNFQSEVDKFFAPIRDPLIEEENGRMAYLIENKIDFVHCNCGADNCRQILFIDTQMIGKPENDRKTVYNNIPHNTRFKGTILF